jgi:hypothetical protein
VKGEIEYIFRREHQIGKDHQNSKPLICSPDLLNSAVINTYINDIDIGFIMNPENQVSHIKIPQILLGIDDADPMDFFPSGTGNAGTRWAIPGMKFRVASSQQS